jgi:hypothetical protein
MAMNRIPPLRVRAALVGTAFVLTALAARPAAGQGDARLTLGVTAFTLSESGPDPEHFDPIARLSAGVGVSFPFRSGLSVRPELHYVTRGAAFDGVVADQEVDVVLELTTLELGIMAGLDVPLGGAVQPRVFAGPVFGWTAESTLRYRPLSGGSWFSDSYPGVRRTDVAFGFGAEVTIPAGPTRLIAGVRGVAGLTGILKAEPPGETVPDWRHRGAHVYVGLGL